MATGELRWTFTRYRDLCVWLRTCFNTNMALFDSGDARKRLMAKTAPLFFRELNDILIENYFLQVCKITDPPSTTVKGVKRFNLTLDHVNDLLREEKLFTPEMEAEAKTIKDYRELVVLARNRQIAHPDKETAMAYINHGRHSKAEAQAFLVALQTYLDLVGVAVGEGPLDISVSSGPGDVADLFRALNGGQYVRD